MSDTPFVYRSAAPQVVEAWTEACEVFEDYLFRTAEILADAGLRDNYEAYRHTGWNRGIVAGIKIPEGGTVPEGWRMTRAHERMAVPDKRRKAGKDVYAKLEAYPYPGVPSQRLPGMPPYVLAGQRMWTPGVRLLEDGAAVYARWPGDPEEAIRGGDGSIDVALWSRARLSAYYAEVERADAMTGDGAGR